MSDISSFVAAYITLMRKISVAKYISLITFFLFLIIPQCHSFYASSSSFLDKPITQCSTEGLRLSLAINQPQAPILASEEPDNCRLILLFDGLYYSQKTTSAHVWVAFNLAQHHYSCFQGESWTETEGKSSEDQAELLIFDYSILMKRT